MDRRAPRTISGKSRLGIQALNRGSEPDDFMSQPSRQTSQHGAAGDTGWRVALWGKNLTDEEYARTSTGTNFLYTAEPLTCGLDLGYSF